MQALQEVCMLESLHLVLREQVMVNLEELAFEHRSGVACVTRKADACRLLPEACQGQGKLATPFALRAHQAPVASMAVKGLVKRKLKAVVINKTVVDRPV